MVSPRKRPRVSIVAGLSVATIPEKNQHHRALPILSSNYSPELSSFEASSTTSRFGLIRWKFSVSCSSTKEVRKKEEAYDFLGRKIAVDVSSGPGWGGAPLGSAIRRSVSVCLFGFSCSSLAPRLTAKAHSKK